MNRLSLVSRSGACLCKSLMSVLSTSQRDVAPGAIVVVSFTQMRIKAMSGKINRWGEVFPLVRSILQLWLGVACEYTVVTLPRCTHVPERP